VFAKRAEAVGDGSNVDPTRSLASAVVGRKVQEWGPDTGDGIGEMVRYKVTVTATGSNSWAIFRMLDPVWFDAILSESTP